MNKTIIKSIYTWDSDFICENDYVIKEDILSNVYIGTMLISKLLTFFSISNHLVNLAKIDKKLSKKLSKIIKEKIDIRIIKDNKIPNAFCYGSMVFITTKLLKMLSEREITSVLIHEIKHKKAIHHYKIELGKTGLTAIIIKAVGKKIDPFKSSTPTLSVYAFLFCIMFGLISSSILTNIFIQRRYEYQSDTYTTKFGYGKELISSLKKLEKFYTSKNPPLKCETIACKMILKLEELISSHPSLEKRIENILKSEELNKSNPNMKKVKSVIEKNLKSEK